MYATATCKKKNTGGSIPRISVMVGYSTVCVWSTAQSDLVRFVHPKMAACDVEDKKPIEDLCSTDSGTSYTSSTSGVSEKRLPESDFDPRQTNLNFFHDFANIESVISGRGATKLTKSPKQKRIK